MTKILYINVTYRNASTGRIIQDIVAKSSIEDFEYKVFFQLGDNEDAHGVKFENHVENFIRRCIHKLCGNVNWVTVNATKRLIQMIKDYNPDLIHLHTLHHQCTNYRLLFDFLKEYGKPIVYSIHDCWVYTGGCFHYTCAKCDEFVKCCTVCNREKEQLECRPAQTEACLEIKADFYNSAEIYFVGVSNWITKEAQKGVLKGKNIRCIRNGVDIDVFRPRSWVEKEVAEMRAKLLGNRKYIVLGVANAWSEEKGLYEFLELAKTLGGEYQIVLVGGMFRNILADVTRVNNVLYYGLTYDEKELALIYNSADVLVNLSREESFGLVTAEAAVSGIPVIAYDSTANGEVIHLAQGQLIDCGNTADMLEAIRKVCLHKSQHEVRIETVRYQLSKARMNKEYWTLYSEIIQNRGEKIKDNVCFDGQT